MNRALIFQAIVVAIIGLCARSAEAQAQHHGAAPARKVILQIAFVDQRAVSNDEVAGVYKILSDQFPGTRIITVTTPAGAYRNASADLQSRKQMIRKIQDLHFAADEEIGTLVIQTHGESSAGEDWTKIHLIGRIIGDSPDDDFVEFFKPLEGRFAPDTNVILHTCSSFCGTDTAAARRALGFLKLIGANSGTLYGSMTDHIGHEKSLHLKLPLRAVSVVAALSSGLAPLVLFGALVTPHLRESILAQPNGAFLFMAKVAAASGVGFYGLIAVVQPLVRFAKIMKLKFNYGRVFSFRDGQLVEVAQKSFTLDRADVFGPKTCEALF